MIFDLIAIAVIIIFSIIGYFKGFLSQLSSLAGIILAFWLSPKWAPMIYGIVRDLFPFSYVISDLFSKLFVGIAIFLVVKIIGKLVEFMLLSKFKELGGFNSWGGFTFGFLKSVLAVFIAMIFVTLIPSKLVNKRFSVLQGSFIYKVCRKYNPVIHPDLMENLRRMAELTRDKSKLENINKSAVYTDYLKTKNIENPFHNERVVETLGKGDVETLKQAGVYDLLKDKDFMDFIYGEKYYKPKTTNP